MSVLFHIKRQGKGAAIRTALPHIRGKYVIIQDADLEYDPMDYLNLLRVAEEGTAVVYGSRNLQRGTAHGYTLYRIGGICLSALANALYGLRLSDETTCYKFFRRDTIQSLGLECDGFEFCAEVTAKAGKRKIAARTTMTGPAAGGAGAP